jgi:hypothetical protein
MNRNVNKQENVVKFPTITWNSELDKTKELRLVGEKSILDLSDKRESYFPLSFQ